VEKGNQRQLDYGPPLKKTGREGKKERVLLSERAHKQVLTMIKNMHLIVNSSTGALVAVAISTVPDGGFHRESMCTQTKPAHIPHNIMMLDEGGQGTDSKVASGGHPHSAHESVNQLEYLVGDRQTKNDESPIRCRFPKGSCQQCPSTLSSS